MTGDLTGAATAAWKGAQAGTVGRYIGYDEAERMVGALLGGAHAWGIEAVAGIARGGIVPATMASCLLSVPLSIIGRPSREAEFAWIGPAPAARRVLLVDDCCASGRTMQAAMAMLAGQGFSIRTLTITHDPDVTAYVPDLSHPMRELFRFPWERGLYTPTAGPLMARGETVPLASEAPFIGLDLDGIFLPDLPQTHYDADLREAIRRRHELEPFSRLPPFDPARAIVITGRPEMDRGLTRAWLGRWGHDGLPLECRPDGTPADPGSVAEYKARAAIRRGCTHFIESDPEQAIRIAALAPHIIVSWWRAEDARAWLIAATGTPHTSAES